MEKQDAKKLSRIMLVLFTVAFLVMLSVAVAAVVFVFFPKAPSGVGYGIGLPHGVRIGFGTLNRWQAVGAMVATEIMVLPILLTLHYSRKLFGCFAKGDIFAAKPIAHIRAAGLWLTVSFFTDTAGIILLSHCGQNQHISPVEFLGTLFIGIPIIIAAYVMEEARRIAADHAEIV
jgi:hypothetical protein